MSAVAQEQTAPAYYGSGNRVFKAPVSTPRDGGGQSISLGFPVLTISEYVADPERAAKDIAREISSHAPVVTALGHMINMLEASLFGQKNKDGVRWEVGQTDVKITPDGSYMLSDARAALRLAQGEE